jgi:hypothetical protein
MLKYIQKVIDLRRQAYLYPHNNTPSKTSNRSEDDARFSHPPKRRMAPKCWQWRGQDSLDESSRSKAIFSRNKFITLDPANWRLDGFKYRVPERLQLAGRPRGGGNAAQIAPAALRRITGSIRVRGHYGAE